MNLAQALAAPRKAARMLELKKANPSQALGGIIIPDRGSFSSVINTGMDPDRLVLYGWKANAFAYTCVDRLASAVAQAYFRVERRTGDGEKDWEPDPTDWRQNLLNYPMGRFMPAQEVFYYFAAWLAIKGNALLRKIPGGPNGVLEIWPMSPKNIVPVPDKVEWISGYNFIEDGKLIWNFPAEEIIHARLPDPSDPLWGFGMLEAAWQYLQADTASAKWRRELFVNGGVPPAIIVDEELTDPLQAPAQAVAMQLAFQRNAKNHVPMLMGGKKTLLNLAFTAQDMQIPEDRALTRDEIVLAFGLHPSMFSNVAATYDNQDAAIRYMYENGVSRLLSVIREALNGALLTQDERQSDSVYIDFDLSQIPFFRRQRESKIAGMKSALESGISRNDYNNLAGLGLDDLTEEEGGDAIFVPSGLTLLKEAAEGVASEPAASFNSFPFNQPKPDAIPTPEDEMPANDEEPATTPA